MNSDVRPSCCSQLQPDRHTRRRSHAYASPTAIVSTPRRSRKKDGDEVQNSERGYGDGRNEAA